MQNHANMPRNVILLLFGEAVKTATKLDWLTVMTLDGVTKSRVEHYCGKISSFVSYLKTFGEDGTVTTGKDGKLGSRGVTMSFVGYADKHARDCYRMFNPHTRQISETRDVMFLRCMYYPKSNTEVTGQEPVTVLPNEGDDAGACNARDKFAKAGDKNDQDNKESVVTTGSASSEPSALEAVVQRSVCGRNRPVQYDPSTGREYFSAGQNYMAMVKDLDSQEMGANLEIHNLSFEIFGVGAGTGDDFGTTTELHVPEYDETVNGPDGREWREEIQNEFKRMKKMAGFQEVNRSQLPRGVKPIDGTWALKKNGNVVCRDRLTTRGFKQVDGIYYDSASIHAPVTNAMSVRMVLALMLMADWTAEVVGVKGEFLHGQFTDCKRMYMEVPRGWREHYNENLVLLLLQTIYGLKQVAMAFWRELLRAMKKIEVERSKADPCMYFS